MARLQLAASKASLTDSSDCLARCSIGIQMDHMSSLSSAGALMRLNVPIWCPSHHDARKVLKRDDRHQPAKLYTLSVPAATMKIKGNYEHTGLQ
jgi:hypothetical protein